MRLLYKTGAMESLRKWFYKPKRDDRSLLAQFFFADETLNMVAAELDSFDGREDPERCSTLVNQLRHAQERVLNITGQIMDQLLGSERVARGFRVKFPEDVLQDNLAGQLWFGAECLAAGSSIMNREEESAAMRPLAKALTRSLETVRALLREHCLRCNQYGASLISCCSEMLHESLKIFDRLFAEFELCYVSAMVPVKSPAEFEVQQHICVLFSETLQRARRIGLLTQDQVDDYDPALMFAIPRLAIVSGLLIFSNGPLSIDKAPDQMSDMFRPFRTLLHKIRQLLWTLDRRELYLLEKLLCTNEDIANIRSSVDTATTDGTLALKMDSDCYPDISEFVTRFYSDNAHCKDMLSQMVGCEWGSNTEDVMQLDPQARDGALSARLTQESDYLPDNMAVLTPILDGLNTLQGTRTEDIQYDYPVDQSIVDAVEPISSSVDDDQITDPSNTVDEITIDSGENREIFFCKKEDIIRLNVQGPENDVITDKDLETIQENINLTLTRSERRNSSLSHASSRKSSRNESISNSHPSDFMIRNLSSNGLSMFDPLAGASTSSVNINPTASDNNVLLPDQLLVSNLSEQVSEIADKLSCITYGEHPDNSIDNMRNFSLMDSSITTLLQDQVAGQIYSFSANDMSNLISNDSEFQISRNNVNYSPSRSDKVIPQLANMPSTSHGYLIPNAISQEPAILTTLSNNNPGMYDDEMFLNPINNPLMISQQSTNLENELFGDSISVANANLSSLLLTNEEFHNRFLAQNTSANASNVLPKCDEASFYSTSNETITSERVAHAGQNAPHQRAKFLIGYDSDPNENTPGDSGICTENTSLDRSPDSEIHGEKNVATSSIVKMNNAEECLTLQNTSNEIDKLDTTCGHFMDQNCILSNDNNQRLNSNDKIHLGDSAQLSNSFSSSTKGSVAVDITDCGEQDVISSLHINYSENSSNVQKNDAGPSHNLMQRPEFIQNSSNAVHVSDISVSDCKHSLEATADVLQTCDKNLCSNYLNTDNVSTEGGSLETNVAVNVDRTCNNNFNASSNIKVDNCDTNISYSVNESSANVRTSISNDTSAISASAENQTSAIESSDSILTATTSDTQTDSSSVNLQPSEEVVSAVDQSGASSNATGVLNQRKLRKSASPKNKKKRSRGSSRETRVWSPGRFVLENRSRVERRSPMRLNLEQLVDDGGGSGDCQSSQSSATSSFHSECADDEEIALALQAQELASRHHTRAKFRSSEDLIHRLFVCIAGVADQLQTNFATDLRNILKSVFLMNQTMEIEPEKLSEPEEKSRKNRDGETIEYEVSESEVLANGDSFDSIYSAEEVYADNSPTSRRSRQSLTALEGTPNIEENVQSSNDLEERHDSQRSTNSRVSETSVNAQQNGENVEQNQDNSNDNQNSPKSFNRKTKTSRSSSSTSSDSNRNNTMENFYDSESLSSNSRVSQVVDQQQFNGNVSVRENSRVNTRAAGGESDETSRVERGHRSQSVSTGVERAPEWVPDIAAPDCMRCRSHFTAFRRRHHCRNCGKVFCATCSSNSIPLPRFGQLKPVRVCEECFQTTAKRTCSSTNRNQAVHTARRQTYTHR